MCVCVRGCVDVCVSGCVYMCMGVGVGVRVPSMFVFDCSVCGVCLGCLCLWFVCVSVCGWGVCVLCVVGVFGVCV